MGQPESTVYNGLFWMIQLFVCVNAVAKSFMQESKGPDALFLFNCKPDTFHYFQINLQRRDHAFDGFVKPRSV